MHNISIIFISEYIYYLRKLFIIYSFISFGKNDETLSLQDITLSIILVRLIYADWIYVNEQRH